MGDWENFLHIFPPYKRPPIFGDGTQASKFSQKYVKNSPNLPIFLIIYFFLIIIREIKKYKKKDWENLI
jgi:hypothetical protein